MEHILVQFGDIDKFLHKEDFGSNATRTKLLDILRDVAWAVSQAIKQGSKPCKAVGQKQASKLSKAVIPAQ